LILFEIINCALMDNKGWFIDSHIGNIKEEYHFIEKIASGGFGIVYLAEHRNSGKWSLNQRYVCWFMNIYDYDRWKVCYKSYLKEKS